MFDTNEDENDNDSKQLYSQVNVSLKWPINVLLDSETAFNVPYDANKKSHTSAQRKGISENRKRSLMIENDSLIEPKKFKVDNMQELSWFDDIKGLTFEYQPCCCEFCNFLDLNLHGKNFPLKVSDSFKWKQNKAICDFCEENVICGPDKDHCVNRVDFVSGSLCMRCLEKNKTFDSSDIVTYDDKEDDKEVLNFVPYGSDSFIVIDELDKEYIDLNDTDHISECFRNLCMDWNLFLKDFIHFDVQHNLNFSDIDSDHIKLMSSLSLCQKLLWGLLKLTPTKNLVDFCEVICSQLEVHCLLLDLLEKSYMYTYETSIDIQQDYCKKPVGWPELGRYNEYPARCTVMWKASESCIISEAEGSKVPIEVQPTYEYFTEIFTEYFTPSLLGSQPNHLYQIYFMQCHLTSQYQETVPLLNSDTVLSFMTEANNCWNTYCKVKLAFYCNFSQNLTFWSTNFKMI